MVGVAGEGAPWGPTSAFANGHLSRETSHRQPWRVVTGFWRGDGGSGGDSQELSELIFGEY